MQIQGAHKFMNICSTSVVETCPLSDLVTQGCIYTAAFFGIEEKNRNTANAYQCESGWLHCDTSDHKYYMEMKKNKFEFLI